MKKKYKRIIKGILFICLSFFICLNVNAKDECPKYRNAVEATNNTNNKKITVKITKGSWKVIMTKTDALENDYDNTYLGEVDLNENNTTATFTYAENQDIRIIFIYNADDDCYRTGSEIIKRIKNNNSYSDLIDTGSQYYVITKTFQAIGSNQSEIGNPYYDSQLCSDFKNGIWNEAFSQYVTKDIFKDYNPAVVGSKGQIEYESYVPFCYKSNISVSADEKLASRIIGGAVSTYYFKHKPTSSTIGEVKGAKAWNPSKKIGLTCDLLKLKGTNDNYYANTNTYVHTEHTEEQINGYTCEKTCQEVLTVEYGPPVASKAGLCFEYKVRVTSKVTCDTNGKDVTPPKLGNYKVCEPVAYCESTSTASNDISAGPNEDFDSCVNTCDNGKYTQKCINKCYKQVYENNNSQLLNYADKVEATKLAATCTGKITDTIPNGAALSNEILQHSGEKACYGKYVRENEDDYTSKISWSPGAAYWTKYARYYFLTAKIAQQTVNHDIVNKGNGTGKITNHGTEYRYYRSSKLDDLQHGYGFKIAASWSKKDGSEDNPAGGFTCNWNCSFINCDGDKYINQTEANKDYEDAYEDYEGFIKKCSAEASCSTTTAEFTINVNNKTKDNPDDNNWIDYAKATLQNSTGTSVDISDDSNIIIDRSACYGKTVKQNEYMTEWSFPGTWINNKTGEISYTVKDKNTWHKKENEFCTSLNTANANVGWWYYGYTGKKINGVTGETMTDQDLKNAVTDKNILATARDFGYFGWDIDIECFYAYYDSAGRPVPPKPDPEENKKCIDKNCDDIEDKDPSQRYRIRTVSNSDLFPSPEGKATTNLTEPGRQPGFNWTVSATNIKNPNYIIAPSALLAEIQTKGDSIYSDDSNVDYEFYLDRNALSSIRKHITSGNYTNFTGSFSIINGVSVYSSSLFRESNNAAEVSLDSKYVIKKGILGCNNEEKGKCYNYPSLTSIGG